MRTRTFRTKALPQVVVATLVAAAWGGVHDAADATGAAATETTPSTMAAAGGTTVAPQSAQPSAPPRGDADLEQQLTDILELHRANQEFVGAVLAMRMADGTTVTVMSGTKELSGDSGDVDATIPWGIGSITKTFIAVVVLQLAEEGEIDLDADIAGFMPDLAGADEITAGNSSSTPVDSVSISTSRRC